MKNWLLHQTSPSMPLKLPGIDLALAMLIEWRISLLWMLTYINLNKTATLPVQSGTCWQPQKKAEDKAGSSKDHLLYLIFNFWLLEGLRLVRLTSRNQRCSFNANRNLLKSVMHENTKFKQIGIELLTIGEENEIFCSILSQKFLQRNCGLLGRKCLQELNFCFH